MSKPKKNSQLSVAMRSLANLTAAAREVDHIAMNEMRAELAALHAIHAKNVATCDRLRAKMAALKARLPALAEDAVRAGAECEHTKPVNAWASRVAALVLAQWEAQENAGVAPRMMSRDAGEPTDERPVSAEARRTPVEPAQNPLHTERTDTPR